MELMKLEGLEKKQSLIALYWNQLAILKEERSITNAKIKKVESAFKDLIIAEADPTQLSLFDDIDQFLQID
jgi:hypothetical protein